MAIFNDKVIHELIDTVYGAAADPAQWPALLARLSRIFHGSASSLHSQNADSQQASVAASWNIGPDFICQYVDYYSQINPCFLSGKALIQQGTVKPRQAFCSDRVMLRSEFYTDYLRHIDAFDGAVATILEDGTVSANLTIFRSRRGKRFSESEYEMLRLLMPHLQRAFQIHNHVQGLEAQVKSVEEIVDNLSQGVVLLDAEGRVLLVNRAAAALFASERALTLTARGLKAAVAFENRHLNDLIRAAMATGKGESIHPGGAMSVSREGLRRPLQVLVTPLRTKMLRLEKEVPVVAIFISDPERKVASDSTIFAQFFGLTPAETRLAEILVAGNSLKEASERLGVAQSTLRSQLKSIFAKTNTNRQSELVRTFLMTPGRRE